MKSVLLFFGNFIAENLILFLAVSLILNLITFILYAVDKSRAKRNKWRIPEATLILLPAIGGGIGAILGMYLIRHKTKHLKFTLFVPLFIILYTLFVAASLIVSFSA